MFRIKVCGITCVEDARVAEAEGADAIGLNFFADSSRFVGTDPSLRALSTPMLKVGVFVNAGAEMIRETCQQWKLNAAQLHGDEPPALVRDLDDIPCVKAFRVRDGDIGPVKRFLDDCDRIGAMPVAILLDGFQQGEYGGAGARVDWKQLAKSRTTIGEIPLILAGGLEPTNVAEAIRIVRPDGVDVASGVESPGDRRRKSPERIAAFVAAARSALDANESH